MAGFRMSSIQENIENYYTKKIKEYGATPKGVDWNGEESQIIRFEQLSRIIANDNFTISDVGCGYGKYSEFLKINCKKFQYRGYDLSKEMIYSARGMYKDNHVEFVHIHDLDEVVASDYTIASGLFSVKMEYTESQWLSYVLGVLEKINNKSKKGFAFNMLTKYSDKEHMRGDLYYADPLFFFDFCKRNFSKEISLNHDYNLYEFTILVRKD